MCKIKLASPKLWKAKWKIQLVSQKLWRAKCKIQLVPPKLWKAKLKIQLAPQKLWGLGMDASPGFTMALERIIHLDIHGQRLEPGGGLSDVACLML